MSNITPSTVVGKIVLGTIRRFAGSAISLLANSEIISYFFAHLVRPTFHLDYTLYYSQALVLALGVSFICFVTQIDIFLYMELKTRSKIDLNRAFFVGLAATLVKFVSFMLTIYILGLFVR